MLSSALFIISANFVDSARRNSGQMVAFWSSVIFSGMPGSKTGMTTSSFTPSLATMPWYSGGGLKKLVKLTVPFNGTGLEIKIICDEQI